MNFTIYCPIFHEDVVITGTFCVGVPLNNQSIYHEDRNRLVKMCYRKFPSMFTFIELMSTTIT